MIDELEWKTRRDRINTKLKALGLLNKTQVYPREVFADPITDRASAIIVAHNHPSGGLIPSKDDLKMI